MKTKLNERSDWKRLFSFTSACLLTLAILANAMGQSQVVSISFDTEIGAYGAPIGAPNVTSTVPTGEPSNAVGLQLPGQVGPWNSLIVGNGRLLMGFSYQISVTTPDNITFTFNTNASNEPEIPLPNNVGDYETFVVPGGADSLRDSVAFQRFGILDHSPRTWEISGLSPNGKYRMIFFGQTGPSNGALFSIDGHDAGNGVGNPVTLDAENDGNFTGVTANSVGVITGVFDTPVSEEFSAWSGLQIQSVENSGLVVSTVSDVVDNTDFETSLREAIAFANSDPDASEISFDPSVFETAQTIALQSSLPNIETPMTITGPGANLLTIDAGDGTDNQFGTSDGFTILAIDDGEPSTQLDVQITGITFAGGDGSFEPATAGGAIKNAETLTLTDSQLIGNNARFGGGLQNSGTAVVTGTTIAGNRASQNGGGIENLGTLTMSNTTVSGNSTLGSGGGLVNFGPSGGTATVDITSSTFTDNAAFEQTTNGIWNSDGIGTASLTLSGSILADSIFSSTTLTGDYNLFSETSNTTGGANDISGVTDAQLGPLADNGGPTMTHALLAGSPALNAGDPLAVADVDGVPEFDQRGLARVTFNRIDIGALEMQILLGDVNQDGLVNLLDIEPFVELVSNGSFQAEADLNQDGVANLLDIEPFVGLLSN